MLFLNKVSNVVDSFAWKINTIYCTNIMVIKMRLIGIKPKKNLRFYGMTKFKKSSSATITIGSDCTFRSKHTSNLIGINRPCIFSTLTTEAILTVGDNCGFSGTVIGCFTNITIGNNVKCGANTLITDSDWHQDDYRSGEAKPVEIADNVWLGEGVKVLKGVTIGENSIIGAGSVVTKNIPANVIAAGNPCKELKPLAQK
jgi:acetyltransferase-like isoleucine patch superfamily enzyme